MPKKLVIVESPSKAKTINKILGKEYLVRSSVGHIRNLPENKFGVDIKNSFKPEYVIIKGKKKIIDELKKAVEKSDIIYLAPDPDREGEAIAWHLKEVLKRKNKSKDFFRVQYNEVTPQAVKSAFENPGEINLARVNAQQARRILDRIVGFKVSSMLWRRIRKGLSAGRVQSVALRLVCEKEEEINKFVPEKYWILEAKVRKLVPPLEPFKIKLIRINNVKQDIKNKEEVEEIKADLENASFKAQGIFTKIIIKKPFPPYITSTLQQAGTSYCGFSPKRTMRIAHKHYEGIDLGDGPTGLITYMRTDSFSVAQDALDACRNLIENKFGKEYLPVKPNFYKSRASAQEAHEAIRPTDVIRTPDSIKSKLDASQYKLYKLIWQRFVASQMSWAKIEQRTARVEAVPEKDKKALYLFQATASEIKFPGYMKISEKDKKKKDEEVGYLPSLIKGENLECLKLIDEEKEVNPPPRYSESSLIKELEKNGVGRPSTYAYILATLQDRNYVIIEKKSLVPTEIGIKVYKLLMKTLDALFNVKFTVKMEESLDEIEKGNIKWTKMMEDFYKQFKEWMTNAEMPTIKMPTKKGGYSDMLKSSQYEVPKQSTFRKLELLKKMDFDKSTRDFLNSLQGRTDKGRPLSEAQIGALNNIVVAHASEIEDYEKIKESLRVSGSDVEADKESKPLLESLSHVEKWNEPVTRGKKVFDDKAFYSSLRDQFCRKGFLSVRQREALKKIASRYEGQIPKE